MNRVGFQWPLQGWRRGEWSERFQGSCRRENGWDSGEGRGGRGDALVPRQVIPSERGLRLAGVGGTNDISRALWVLGVSGSPTVRWSHC